MSDLVGKHFQGYRILGQVGPGGGSNIFKASTHQGNEIVAIKFLPPQIGRNRQIIDKLRASFQATSRLNHPSILQVKSFNVHSGYPYVVTPFMEAGSLDDRIDFGALGTINVLAVIRDVASALEVAHTRGLVHGDLKPSNILFDEDGNVQLNGIGEGPLASMRANQLEGEREGRISYQAPEASAGRQVTSSSDQYSLALIALQMLACLPLDEALSALEHIRRYGRDTITRPSPYALDLTSRMIEVLSRALSEDPTKRFPSMQEWQSAFVAAFTNEQPRSEPKSEQVQAAPEKHRRNRFAFLAPVFALFLCLVIAVPVLSSRGDGPLGGVLVSLGLVKESPTSVVSSTEEGAVENVTFGTAVPVEKGADLDTVPAKATLIPETQSSSGSGGGAPDASTNTPVPPAKTDAPKDPVATQESPDQATSTFTPTPTPTIKETATVTSTPTATIPLPTNTSGVNPTIDPDKCKAPGHPQFGCTPTPSP